MDQFSEMLTLPMAQFVYEISKLCFGELRTMKKTLDNDYVCQVIARNSGAPHNASLSIRRKLAIIDECRRRQIAYDSLR
jgi:hypothetical protein